MWTPCLSVRARSKSRSWRFVNQNINLEKRFSKKFQIRAPSLSLQVVEEDVDHIAVVGEEEEETRVSIFLFLYF